MVARLRSTSPKRTFSASSTGGVLVKAKLRRSEKKKIAVKFYPVCSRAKRSAPRSPSSLETETRDRRIMSILQKSFVRHTPTSLTKRSMEFETGRAGDVRRRGKRLGVSPPARLREKFWARFIRKSPKSRPESTSRK